MKKIKNYWYCIIWLFICLFPPNSLWGQAPFFVIRPLKAGLFAEFNLVLGALNNYEKLLKYQLPCAGLRIDFGREGLYYDPRIGDNFWQYYFEPIEFGNQHQGTLQEINDLEKTILAVHMRYELAAERSYELIQKYIRVKPRIQQKVNTFCKDNFMDRYILGIHYRGTDKSLEAPRVSYEAVHRAIIEHITHVKPENFKIFVASDEAAFIEFIEDKFPNIILKYDLERSQSQAPLHQGHQNPFEIGEGALIDCLLLSRSNFLIRTSSNLSYAASQFNPQIPVIELSEGYWEQAHKKRKK